MSIVRSWLTRQVSPESPLSPPLPSKIARENGQKEEERGTSQNVLRGTSDSAHAATGDSDSGDTSDSAAAWTDRPDVITVVEDLFRERWKPRRIARTLGLTLDEVVTILRRSGR
jgi:hypothetical protein